MSIYKGYGGYGSPAQNERRYEELCEAYADAKERVEELESEVERLKERNQYLEDAHDRQNKYIGKLKLDIEDYNAFGSDLLVELMVAFYSSDAMDEFKKCFTDDEIANMEIEAKYQQAEMLKEEED